MIRIIHTSDIAACDAFLAKLRGRAIAADADLLSLVSKILSEVRQRGDKALVEYTARFDGVQLTPAQLRVSAETINDSAAECDAQVLASMREAIANVRRFHERQKEESWRLDVGTDSWVGQRITPIQSVGLYVPGGTAAYPSSVVMNVVPAQVAGVPRIVVVTPPGAIQSTPAVAAALAELGISEVYSVGGAHAIGALAYGTASIRRVDKITGPGNKYVAAAKKLVFGDVGIDSIAGPSEVVIVADETASGVLIAADLLAQAEHGEDASAIVITTNEELAQAIVAEVTLQTATLPRKEIVEESLKNFGAILVVKSIDAAAEFVNQLAPEHVELMTRENERLAELITDAGAIFIGPHSPEALGDYFAGPNHVLPTGGTARFSSALSVYDFIKRTSLISYSQCEMERVAIKIALFAEAEGLSAHARSVLIRRRKEQEQDQ
jgi:histidinol dehydrogenase